MIVKVRLRRHRVQNKTVKKYGTQEDQKLGF